MAQKKLLLVVVTIITPFLMANSYAEENEMLLKAYVPELDRDWLKGLADQSQDILISNIAENYRELLTMKNKNGKDNNSNLPEFEGLGNDFRDQVTLKVFVSSSMSKELLKSYAREAKIYGGILVFNGLPDNSWVKLNNMIKEIVEDHVGIAIQINPEEFERFNIKSVPAFVLFREENWLTSFSKEKGDDRIVYDKVTGNIGMEAALRLFAENGELRATAQEKLENAKDE